MKLIFRIVIFFLRGVIGLVAIYFTNILTANYNIEIGMNFITGCTIGLLGIPGYILLYVLALMDKLLFI
jgi:inhibitor of the pro-sigma K processing machinery